MAATNKHMGSLSADDILEMLGDSDVDIPGEISSGEDEEHDFNEYLEEYSSEDDVPLASLRSPNSEKGTPKNKKWTRDKMPPYVHDVEDLFCENEEGSQNFLDMFFEYFPPSFWKSVVEQSNLYSVQVRDHRSINMTYDEIIRFVGVSILMERDGLVLDFHIYVGKGTIPDKDMRELGLGAGIVKLLTRTISHSIIYCDRFFTSEKLGIEDQQIDHEDQTQQKRRRIIHPVNDVRFDRINHWPIFSNDKNASRCRHWLFIKN
ncbi:uncharacterized protein LOC124173302 [Ischnura elegans]|uniref:uncharacterized protein LOC124173302 n=1 Tax=Ischnura elegans TaxID=197161 RepID=UPI001ED87C01|nr:uncharacterized protein LOC124173302 [Ischnura elegans]